MTRYLSQALGAIEPLFSQSIGQLEQTAGAPSADIRLTAEVMQHMRDKIAALGLDPKDTTGPELYSALFERLKQDELRVRAALDIPADALPNDIMLHVQRTIAGLDIPQDCFALKGSAAKRLFKKKPPKLTMKLLGYRSLDSMLKQEQPANLYAATLMAEPQAWHKTFRDQYAKLQSSDFEQRRMQVLSPQSSRWLKAAEPFVQNAHHNLLNFKELGAIVLLPAGARVDGLAITTLLLVLEYMNDIRAYSSFAKLQQVKPQFGRIIQASSDSEPLTTAHMAGQAVPWRMIQRYYGRSVQAPDVFEPHVQADDLQWHAAEDVLAHLVPELSFWQDTQALCLLHNGQPVSCNMLDVALSFCNRLPFADRIVHFVRDNLWHELMMRYLHEDNLQHMVLGQLNRDLVAETVAE
ncbi:MAG TPA: hypothetical protein VMY99_03745 [Nevskiaceae bacterium]|nr:hypothetical protein [Nevskiaceae bacterium]